MKTCERCKKEKTLTSFGKNKSGNRKNICRSCKNKRIKQNKKEKEEKTNRIENIIGKKGKVKVTHISNKWSTRIVIEEAELLFKVGCAEVISPQEIVFSNMRLLKRYILQRDNHCCAFCGEYGDTLDHIQPRKRGGTDLPSNLVTSCKKCNELKSDTSVVKFLRGDMKRCKYFFSSGYAKRYRKIVLEWEKVLFRENIAKDLELV